MAGCTRQILELPGSCRGTHYSIPDFGDHHEIDEVGVLARAMGVVAYNTGSILQDDVRIVREPPGVLEQRGSVVTAVAQCVARGRLSRGVSRLKFLPQNRFIYRTVRSAWLNPGRCPLIVVVTIGAVELAYGRVCRQKAGNRCILSWCGDRMVRGVAGVDFQPNNAGIVLAYDARGSRLRLPMAFQANLVLEIGRVDAATPDRNTPHVPQPARRDRRRRGSRRHGMGIVAIFAGDVP